MLVVGGYSSAIWWFGREDDEERRPNKSANSLEARVLSCGSGVVAPRMPRPRSRQSCRKLSEQFRGGHCRRGEKGSNAPSILPAAHRVDSPHSNRPCGPREEALCCSCPPTVEVAVGGVVATLLLSLSRCSHTCGSNTTLPSANKFLLRDQSAKQLRQNRSRCWVSWRGWHTATGSSTAPKQMAHVRPLLWLTGLWEHRDRLGGAEDSSVVEQRE